MAETSRSQVLNKIRRRSKGAYNKVKTVEAKVGGKELSGGLKDAYALTSGAKLDEFKSGPNAGHPYVLIYAKCVEPEEERGAAAHLMYPISEDKYNSYDQNLEKFLNDMKLIGFEEEVDQASDETVLIETLLDFFQNNATVFRFNTSRRQRKDGGYNIFVQGLPPDDYQPPEVEAKNDHKDKGYSPPAKSASPKFEEGDAVVAFDYYEEDYEGTITSVKAKSAVVEFEDGEEEIPFENLRHQE